MRDNYKYVNCCLLHVVQTIEDKIPSILAILEEEIIKLSKETDENLKYNWEEDNLNGMPKLKGNLGLMNVLYHVLNSQLLKTKVVTTSTLTILFRFIDYCDSCKTNKMVNKFFIMD